MVSRGENMKEFLNPDWFEVRWARILRVAGLDSHRISTLKMGIAKEYGVLYATKALKLYVDQLIQMGLMEQDEQDPQNVRVTLKGREVWLAIERLSIEKPDPWQKYTRKSFSPNYGIESRLGEAPTTGGVPVCADARTW